MSLIGVSFEATGAVAEAWADALLETGAIAVDVADARAGTVLEKPLEEAAATPCGWEHTRVTALFASDADIDRAIVRAAAAIGRAPVVPSIEAVPEDDWVLRTRAQFQPIRASARIWIVPSWCEPVEASALNLTIDPGLAFGTGSHPSTRLCLKWLDTNLGDKDSVLDYGCGSGVLAIAAARLGANCVFGVDIDDQALKASRANARANKVKARFMQPRSLRRRDFDAVVANILAGPLEELAPQLATRVAAGGSIVLSGILGSQAPPLLSAYQQWFNIVVWAEEDGWVALAGSRRHEHG
jgi:ribosomal protein L11 methyltransferase